MEKNLPVCVTADPRIECILVNIFGGIVNCNTVADGLINALKKLGVSCPVVVRLQGTNSSEAREKLAKCGIDLFPADSLEHAALLAVSKGAKGKGTASHA